MQQIIENPEQKLKEMRFLKIVHDLKKLVQGQMTLDISEKKYATFETHPLRVFAKNLNALQANVEKEKALGHMALNKENLENLHKIVTEINGIIQ